MAAIINASPGYWANGGANGQYALLSNEKANLSFRIRRELKKRGLLSERAVLPVLAGNPVGAGGAVNAGYNRISYGNTPATLPGGVQPVEAVVAHTGVTTATDEAIIDGLATFNTQPVYPRNGDGNPRGNNGG